MIAQAELSSRRKVSLNVEIVEEEYSQFDQILNHGIEMFNEGDIGGIEYILEQKLNVEATVKNYATVLFVLRERLDNVGELLGNNEQLSDLFASMFQFKGMKIDFALRMLFQHMTLPDYAVGVSTILQSFAGTYMAQNPGYFANVDVIYVLGFSTVLLNIDCTIHLKWRRVAYRNMNLSHLTRMSLGLSCWQYTLAFTKRK
mmetsp:Transcript_12757/g.27287  ORF Transcript_12757/g.27287 Transcript_12757/m.27287 type:complete len:201 (-) Transcript_12757:408-1010(-)